MTERDMQQHNVNKIKTSNGNAKEEKLTDDNHKHHNVNDTTATVTKNEKTKSSNYFKSVIQDPEFVVCCEQAQTLLDEVMDHKANLQTVRFS